MATLDVLNLDCFTTSPKREKYLAMARGYSEKDDMGDFNGGILNPQREHLSVGQNYYRFVSRSLKAEYKTGGAWWIDADTLNSIYNRFRVTGANPRTPYSAGPASSTIREWLALTFEWNMIEEIVISQLQARLDCYSGFGRVARGHHDFDTRGFGYAPHLSNLFTIKQLCVPEVYKHQDTAFPTSNIVPFEHFEAVARGQIV